MFDTKIKWVRFFSDKEEMSNAMGNNSSLQIQINNKDLILLFHENEYYLIKNKCPHQGQPMLQARCEGKYVVCPFHQYHFSLEHGRGHGLYLDNYPVKINEEGVFAGFEYLSIF